MPAVCQDGCSAQETQQSSPWVCLKREAGSYLRLCDPSLIPVIFIAACLLLLLWDCVGTSRSSASFHGWLLTTEISGHSVRSFERVSLIFL